MLVLVYIFLEMNPNLCVFSKIPLNCLVDLLPNALSKLETMSLVMCGKREMKNVRIQLPLVANLEVSTRGRPWGNQGTNINLN